MRVVLVYNQDAGGASDFRAAARTIEARGHEVLPTSCKEPRCDALLAQHADLVVVNGGDGTVGRVAKALASREVPLLVIVGGTANNIGLTLELADASLDEQLDAWERGSLISVDVGEIRAPWGVERFIEGVGCGLFASSMGTAERSLDRAPPEGPAESLARALQILKERAGAFPAMHIDATLDGKDVSGDYLVFEAMNTRFVGPNLFLAPGARTDDKTLDIVVVDADERETLQEHLAIWQRGALEGLPLRSLRGRELELRWTGFDLHVDDEIRPRRPRGENVERAPIAIHSGSDTVRFVVPPAK
jgi:diacylglycerol kinase (ATP)